MNILSTAKRRSSGTLVRRTNVALSFATASVVLALGVVACGAPPQEPVQPQSTSAAATTTAPAPTPAKTEAAQAPPTCTEPAGPRPVVVNLTTQPDGGEIKPIGADKSPAVEKACQKVLARRTKLLKNVPEPDHIRDLTQCFPSAKGAWVVDASDVRPLKKDKTHTETGWTVPFALSYVSADGKLNSSKKVVGNSHVRGQERVSTEVVATFDFDGDGISEIVLREFVDYGEEDSSKLTMYTWKDGEVGPYSKVNFEFVGMRDVDSDGRPDLLVEGPFGADGPCGLDGQTFRAPPHVAHSLSDGTFSENDAVAKEVVRVQCGPVETELLVRKKDTTEVEMDDYETARRLTCARIYGAKAKDLVDRVRKDYPFPHNADDTDLEAGPHPCLPLTTLVKLVGQEPEFTVDPPCPKN